MSYQIRLPFERENVTMDVGKESKTKQAFADETDINSIVARFVSTGNLGSVNTRVPTYGDNSDASDLQSSMNAVDEAQAEFMELPSRVRESAENSSVRFLEMLSSEDTARQLQEAGLELGIPEKEAPAAPGGIASDPAGDGGGGEKATA